MGLIKFIKEEIENKRFKKANWEKEKKIKDLEDKLEKDKKNVNTLMRLARLYEEKREGWNNASKYYTMAAKELEKDGFYGRSASIYKKIVEIEPEKRELHLKLQNLYGKLGLSTEAQKQEELYLNSFRKSGLVI